MQVALKFDTPLDFMWTDVMPQWFRRETFLHVRNYISHAWNSSFDDAFGEFSKFGHCPANVLASYAVKFENKYYLTHLNTDTVGAVGVASNRGREMDIRIGCCRSFDIGCDNISRNNDDHILRYNNSPLFAKNRSESINAYYEHVSNYLSEMRPEAVMHMKNSCKNYLGGKWTPLCVLQGDSHNGSIRV
ncbi:unnamed protein product [Rotaria magnacalcarata]|uniref:Uncharacterized protein n=1 Tax=Rotaria magnacalcarata TaxID=392030 RepID=A0A820NRD8_9BILA|nr:unnamed protein product [Rotaria magnacalcarata]CAF4394857.1 unnamed protein product [Rotaria magnacalcarata]